MKTAHPRTQIAVAAPSPAKFMAQGEGQPKSIPLSPSPQPQFTKNITASLSGPPRRANAGGGFRRWAWRNPRLCEKKPENKRFFAAQGGRD